MLSGSPNKLFIRTILLIIITVCQTIAAFAQLSNDTTKSPIVHKDTVITTTAGDAPLKSKVKYTAKDSMRFDVANQKMYLFGEAEVIYEALNLKAGYIELDLKNNIVYATGKQDSVGQETQLPVFTEGTQSFKSHKMTYNFQTKKGRINEVITKEADGYIHGETIKKDSSNTVYIRNGRYTTCDLEHPHFAIRAKKLKVIPNDKIVTGPAYLEISDIPTPLCVPFGFFPNKRGQKSGILIPTYGSSTSLGYFLRDGGFYWGISDRMDLTLRGDIYSRLSWGAKGSMNYVKRYRHTGNIQVNFSTIKTGEKELPTHTETKDFILRWSHRQDDKARPGLTFSASVNAGTSNYNKFNSYNPNVYLNNTLQSNISLSKIWVGKPFNLSVAARHSQNTQTKKIDISLPQINFSVNRLYPFKSKTRIIPMWYDKIGVSYTAELRNDISTYDSLFMKPQMFKEMKNGFHQSIPISTSLNVLKYFTVSPSVNYNSSIYYQTISKRYDPDSKKIFTDTVKGVKMENDFILSTNLNTKIYGNYQFKRAYVKQIRHLVIPNVAYSYRPDFSEPQWGAYKKVRDSTGAKQEYSIYQNNLYGAPPAGQSSLVSFSLNNTLEAKVRSKKDTVTGEKKISLIDMFTISSSYNTAINQFRWSNISMNARTKLFKVLDVNFNGVLDPYQIDEKGKRIEKFQWEKRVALGRLVNYGLSLSTGLRSKTNNGPKKSDKGTKDEVAFINKNPGAYVDFNVPWSLNMFYTYNTSKSYAIPGVESITRTQSLSFNGDVSLTQKWKIGFNSGYDFKAHDFTYTQLNIYRDLHCWEMKITWVPFGRNQSYLVDINVKSAVLQDLKLTRRRDWYDLQQ